MNGFDERCALNRRVWRIMAAEKRKTIRIIRPFEFALYHRTFRKIFAKPAKIVTPCPRSLVLQNVPTYISRCSFSPPLTSSFFVSISHTFASRARPSRVTMKVFAAHTNRVLLSQAKKPINLISISDQNRFDPWQRLRSVVAQISSKSEARTKKEERRREKGARKNVRRNWATERKEPKVDGAELRLAGLFL